MSDDQKIGLALATFHTEQELLAELNRLRINAGRSRGKVRLSLQDLETATGVPKSSLANYLTGRTLMPSDVLDRLVIALGASPAESRDWAMAWERVTAHRLQSRVRSSAPESPAPAKPKGTADPDDRPVERPTSERNGPAVREDKAGGGQQATGSRWQDHSPYPGLLPFREDQAEVFYGRELLTARLVQLIAKHRSEPGMIVVTGASGAGKSSLVRAGLLPSITEGRLPVAGSADWPHLVITPTSAPLDELATQLAALIGADATTVRQNLAQRPDHARLLARQAVLAHADQLPADRREQCRANGRLMLVVDQFEELFSAIRERTDIQGHRSAYLTALLSMTAPDHGTGLPSGLVVLTVRGDFIDRCAGYAELVPVLQNAQFIVGPMTAGELRRAITGPAVAAGLTIEDGLTDEILAELRTASTADGFGAGALPMLSQAMLLTWQHREGDRLTRRGYGTTGGAARVIETSAEAVYQTLPDTQQKIVQQLFRRLVDVSADGTLSRRPVAWNELLGLCQHDDPAEARRVRMVLDALAEKRLVVIDQGTVEVAHDVLLHTWPRLRSWLAGDRNDRLLYRQLRNDAATWHGFDQDRSFLYRGARLANIREAVARWAHHPDRSPLLTPSELAFLAASAQVDGRSIRIRRMVATIMALLLLVATTGAVTAARYAAEAGRQRAIALSRMLTLRSQQLEPDDPVTARRLAVAAWFVAPTAEARKSMLTLATQQQRSILAGHTGTVSAIAFSPDGRLLATASHDGTVRLWDPATGDPVGSVLRHDGAVGAVTFRADGRLLATGGHDTVWLWDPATGHRLDKFSTGVSPIKRIDFAGDRHLLATNAGGRTRVWDIPSRNIVDSYPGDEWDALQRVRGPNPGDPLTVALSPDRRFIVVGGYEGEVPRLFRNTGDSSVEPLTGHAPKLTAAGFSPDGRLLVTAGGDRTIQLWNPETGKPMGEPLTGLNQAATAVAFSPDSQLLATGGPDGTARLWNPDNLHMPINDPIPYQTGIIALTVDLDGSLLTTMGADGTWQGRHILSGRQAGITRTDLTSTAAFSPEGRILVTSTGGAVTLWRSAAGDPVIQQPLSDSAGITALALTRDELTLATAGANGRVRLWETATGRPGSTPLTGHIGRVHAVAFSSDESVLASGGEDSTVRLWDRRTGRAVGRPLVGHAGAVTTVAFSPDGKLLATGSTDETVRLWDPNTGQPIGSPLSGHQLSISTIVFSPDGKLLASGSWDGTVRLWDPNTGQLIGEPLVGHSNAVTAVAFSSEGHLLVTGSADQTVRLWNPKAHTDPVGYLCPLVGGPTQEEWERFAPGEPLPKVCS